MTSQLQSLFQNLGTAAQEAPQAAHQGRARAAARGRGGQAASTTRTSSCARSSGRAERHRLHRRDRQGRQPRRDCGGPDVSREGVQRDLLPMVEGCTVSTKYGMVRTDHILFIASGAFHMAKPSDLIPELQGRLPIRVELDALSVGRLRPHPDRARRLADQPVPGPARDRGREARVHARRHARASPSWPGRSTSAPRTSAPGACTRSWSGCWRSVSFERARAARDSRGHRRGLRGPAPRERWRHGRGPVPRYIL